MESVGTRLSEANGLPPLRYFVLDDSDQNAFVSPTGVVVVYKGLLDALDSPDQLAIVLAHEMAHFLARECRQAVRLSGLPLVVAHQNLLFTLSGVVRIFQGTMTSVMASSG